MWKVLSSIFFYDQNLAGLVNPIMQKSSIFFKARVLDQP